MPRANKHPPPPPPPTPSTAPTPTSPLYFYAPTNHLHAYLCQMYPSPFTLHATTYTSAEQYMMYHKSLTFSSPSTAAAILTLTSPCAQKYLVRALKPTPAQRKEWERIKVRVVREGNEAKFRANGGELGRRLVGTGERELVEASPRDRIWGVGWAEEEAGERREMWGMNLLGGVLMGVREGLRGEGLEVEDGVEED